MKWNEVTWYSKLAAIIFFLGIFPMLTFYIGTQYEKTLNILSATANPLPETNLIPTYVLGDTYLNVKGIFIADGWKPIIPTEYQEAGINVLPSKTPIDPKFLEISYCSTAMSSTCAADFKKGNLTKRLWLLNESTTTPNGNVQWIWLVY